MKKLLTVKIDPKDKARWQELAAAHGVSLSELIRVRLDGTPPSRRRSADPRLLRQLAGIGNNLNRIARRLNSGERLDVMIEIMDAQRALEELADAHKIY